MLSVNTIQHRAGDIRNRELDYREWLLPGEVLLSESFVSSSTTLTIANDSIELGRRVKFQDVGGVAGETATITVTVTTSKGETKIDTLTVIVTSP